MNNFNNENSNNEIYNNTNTNEVVGVAENAPKKNSWQKELLDWTLSIVIAVVVALLLTNYVFQLVNVKGSSMEPTLHDGDFLYVHKLMYKPEVGDIIVLDAPDDPEKFYIKRIVALEGQTVSIDLYDDKLYVDGEEVEEPYIDPKANWTEGSAEPYTVPKGHVFVLGDNRYTGGSKDSRSLGAIPIENITGKAMFRLFPFDNFGGLYNN